MNHVVAMTVLCWLTLEILLWIYSCHFKNINWIICFPMVWLIDQCDLEKSDPFDPDMWINLTWFHSCCFIALVAAVIICIYTSNTKTTLSWYVFNIIILYHKWLKYPGFSVQTTTIVMNACYVKVIPNCIYYRYSGMLLFTTVLK